MKNIIKKILLKIFQFMISILLIVLIFKIVSIPDFRWLHKNYEVNDMNVITRDGVNGYKEIKLSKIGKYNAQNYFLKKENLKTIERKLHEKEQYPDPSEYDPIFNIEVSGNTLPQKITFIWTDSHRGYQNSYLVKSNGIEPVFHAESSALDPLFMGLTLGSLIIYLWLFLTIYKQVGRLLFIFEKQ